MNSLPPDIIYDYYRHTFLRRCTKEYFSNSKQISKIICSTMIPTCNFIHTPYFGRLIYGWSHFALCSFASYNIESDVQQIIILFYYWTLANFILAICVIFVFVDDKNTGNFLFIFISIDIAHAVIDNRVLEYGFPRLTKLLINTIVLFMIFAFLVENLCNVKLTCMRYKLLRYNSCLTQIYLL